MSETVLYRNCISDILAFMTLGEQIKDTEIDGVCSMHERAEEWKNSVRIGVKEIERKDVN